MSDLKHLTIAGFRGAIKPFSLSFAADKSFTIIYGENASGKSTICDALELLGRAKVGSLENRGLGVTTRYWPSIGRSLADVSVSLETLNGDCSATVARTGDVLISPETSRPRVEVFRRNQILSLIEVTPAARYAAISRFVDVSGVEASEGTLRDLIRDLKKQRDGAAARLNENEITIRQFWETDGSPAPDPFTWAAAEQERGTQDYEKEIEAIRALHSAYTRLQDLPARLRSAQQSVTTAKNAAEQAAAVVHNHLKDVQQDAGAVLGLLQAVQVYLTKHPDPATCPVCESSEKARGLADRVTERVQSFASLQSAQATVASSTQALERAEQQLQLIRDVARQEVAKFEACRRDPALPPDLPLPASTIPNSASGLTSWLSGAAELQAEWKRAEATRHDRRQFIRTLKQSLEMWRVNRGALDDLDQLLPRMEQALKIVEEERRGFTDGMLERIAGEVSRLYEAVHPGEGLNYVRLELDPKKRASLEIGANFAGRRTRPQGYFSESHLDTLGICVFLALAALDDAKNTIIVLDDVLSSVDDAHADRILKVIRSESGRFRHCILTTHDNLWKDRLNAATDHYVELTKWSLTAGVSQ